MAITTEISCDFCTTRNQGFVMAGTVARSVIVDAALEAGWSVWPDGAACCPACAKRVDVTDCADAWQLEAFLVGA